MSKLSFRGSPVVLPILVVSAGYLMAGLVPSSNEALTQAVAVIAGVIATIAAVIVFIRIKGPIASREKLGAMLTVLTVLLFTAGFAFRSVDGLSSVLARVVIILAAAGILLSVLDIRRVHTKAQ